MSPARRTSMVLRTGASERQEHRWISRENAGIFAMPTGALSATSTNSKGRNSLVICGSEHAHLANYSGCCLLTFGEKLDPRASQVGHQFFFGQYKSILLWTTLFCVRVCLSKTQRKGGWNQKENTVDRWCWRKPRAKETNSTSLIEMLSRAGIL